MADKRVTYRSPIIDHRPPAIGAGKPSERRIRSLRKSLLEWFDAERRDWPWRRTADPYRIWVAEVMLQQTRIAVVVPAYRRFLRRFPTVRRLAQADEEAVLAAWSGLGYYRRARALHRAARALVEQSQSTFPRDFATARTLPGVGEYTAAAVLSIAYGQPYAAVDGNVVRVLSRLAGLSPPDARNRPYQEVANQLLPRERAGDWNQALMELGQTVCLPAVPRCPSCPTRRHCFAYQNDQVELFPARRRRRKTEKIHVEMTLMRDRAGNVLLERGAFPFLSHLWLPPARVVDTSETANGRPRGSFRHAILHRDLHVHVYADLLSARDMRREARKATATGVERRLFSDVGLAAIGRSSLLSKALRHAP